MKNRIFGIVFIFGLMTAASAHAQADKPACAVSATDMSAFAALEYDEFNYGENGWRSLSSQGCYYDAGSAIISWLIDHENSLQPAQQRTQHYQAARNFALADRKDVALLQLRLAKDPADAAPGTLDWNAYLDAFGAWLASDSKALSGAIIRLKQQADGEGGLKPNLDAAQRFERCFNKPYLMIEQDASCLAPEIE